jgi:phenylacetic acid degradation operon negative regulatory protein
MLREPTNSLPQRLLVTLLADYRHILLDVVPSSVLVALFLDFDIAPDATRTALSRLVKKSILRRVKCGRANAYALTDDAVKMIDEDTARIFSFGEERSWDGHWTLVAFSVAESERDRRHALRSQLRALGFTPLYDGLWAAAHASVDSARSALEAADVGDALVIRGDIAGDPSAVVAQFRQSWHLDELARQYEELIQALTPLVERVRKGLVAPAEALVARTRAMDAWRVFPRQDPDLPESLLPPNWPRAQARSCLLEAWTRLQPAAELRLRLLVDEAGS